MWVENVPKTFTAQIIWGQKGIYFPTQTAHQNLLHNSVFFILYFEQTWWQQKIKNCLIDLVSEFYQIADLFIFTKEIH